MKNLAIYGAGGFGRETALLVKQVNAKTPTWHINGFYDDGLDVGTSVDGLHVLGGLREINSLKTETALVIAIAEPSVREKLFAQINSPAISFPSLIHPDFSLGADNNIIGKGCILAAGSILTTGVVLGDFVIINLLCSIGHDVEIGAFCSIMPGCSISGNVKIGTRCSIGTGVRILQNLSIGKSTRVGAGAVVTRDFGDGKTVVGIPAHEK